MRREKLSISTFGPSCATTCAASILAGASAPDAAEAALYAARAFLVSGDRAAADEQLAVARAFYSSVGATQRIRVADTLLAATA
jgi:hypothetical protein